MQPTEIDAVREQLTRVLIHLKRKRAPKSICDRVMDAALALDWYKKNQ